MTISNAVLIILKYGIPGAVLGIFGCGKYPYPRIVTFVDAFIIVIKMLTGLELAPVAASAVFLIMFGFCIHGALSALLCILGCCAGMRIWGLIMRGYFK